MRFVACYANKPRAEAAIKAAQKQCVQMGGRNRRGLGHHPGCGHRAQKAATARKRAGTRMWPGCSRAARCLTPRTCWWDTAEAGEQIVHFARREKADIIFLGLRKRSLVGKMLFGSNAQYIILNAPCPVLTVRRDMEE